MKLYFDNRNGKHDYIDEFSFKYTSTTTLIHKFQEVFDNEALSKACERIGRNPKHPKYEKYKGMSAWQIKKMWDNDAIVGCEHGNFHHDRLEDNINLSMFTHKPQHEFSNSKGQRLFTIDEILQNPDYGQLDLVKFRDSVIREEYPEIYDMIFDLVNKGYSIYVEIGLFDFDYKVSGLGDIIPIHLEKRHFFVLDWKTNKIPIIKEAGYFDKDNKRNVMLDRFIASDKKLKYCLSHLPDANYYIYALQLNTYQKMIEARGFKCGGRLIIHIRREKYSMDDCIARDDMRLLDRNVINFVPIEDLQVEVAAMFEHKRRQDLIENKAQLNLFS